MMKNKPIMNEIMNDKAIIVQYKKRIRSVREWRLFLRDNH